MEKNYRKKPVEASLVQFTGNLIPGVKIRDNGSAFVWNELHKSEINIERGDFVNITTPGDYYPIKKEVVERDFEKL